MTITCFIIDDEPLALQLLESYVAKTPFLQITGKFSSATAAMPQIMEKKPELLFLDIQMAELSGMELAKMVPENTRIIFTTAFQQYAIDSYKVNALDYLLKPFSYSDFMAAANKAVQWFELKNQKANPAEPANDCIYVKADSQLVQIKLQSITYIEGLKDYLKIYTDENDRPVITHLTMKSMEELLPANQFLRVHKSFIVQTNKIKIIERSRIVFGKTYIPISDTYKEQFLQIINARTIK